MLSRFLIAISVFVFLGPALAQATPTSEADARAHLAGLRLPFIANQGQVDARAAFYAPTFAGTMFVTGQGELVYSLPAPTSAASGRRATAQPGWTLTETLRGERVRPVGQEPSATRVSYFLGNDPARWRPEVPTYDQLSLGEVWPGVTVALRVHGRSIEKVFTVHPGASVARIRVRVGGASALAVDSEGALVARTGLGPVTFTAPVAYQERDGVRRPVSVAYRVTRREYGFTAVSYDPALPLVIDPLLQSTYLGGSGNDSANAIAIHPTTGDVYVAGSSASTNFPHSGGGAQPASGGGQDAFVARLTSALTSLTQATYLGGSGSDIATALATHPTTGDVYLVGLTSSTNLPATGGGAQPASGGGQDAFVARLTSALTSLTQATYLGGSGGDQANALAIHLTTGDVYVAGSTASTNFPATGGGAQPASGGGFDDAFVARLTSTLTSLTQATYLGGSQGDGANALAIHPTTGDVYVAGSTFSTNLPATGGGAQPASGGSQDAFVGRLTSVLTSLTQATYLGGSGSDVANALAIHPTTGDVYVTGGTTSTDFPHTAGGAQPASGGGSNDAFVARLTGALTGVLQATYLGGSGSDVTSALAIHPTIGDVYVAGGTSSTNFPHTAGGAQPASGGLGDAFVTRLTSALTLVGQATYLGGSDVDSANTLAIHPTTGDVYVVGPTASTNFPQTGGGAQPTFGGGQDAFVARLTSGLALADPFSVGFSAAGIIAVTARSSGAAAITATLLTGTTQSLSFAALGLPAGATAGFSTGACDPTCSIALTITTTVATSPGTYPVTVSGRMQSNTATFDLVVFAASQLTLAASVSRSTVAVGETQSLSIDLTNPGIPGVVSDIFLGTLRPDGTVEFFTSTGIVVGTLADLRPIVSGLSLAAPFTATAANFFSRPRTGTDLKGSYIFFIAMTGGGQLLGVSSASYSFP